MKTPAKSFNSYLIRRAVKNSSKITEYKRKLTLKAEKSGVIKKGWTIIKPSYKKHFYCDKASGKGWFFRLKPVKEKGSYPVVIYLHGNGLNRATKNDIQMYEFNPLCRNLNKMHCHQVAVHTDYGCEYNTDEFSRAVDGIIDYIKKEYKNVNSDKIYLIGTSHGGYACIHEVLRYPEKFAGAVIAMGYTFNEINRMHESLKLNGFWRDLNDEDYKTISNTPLYLAWAKNDDKFITASNELLSSKLKQYGGTVETKIYDNGAHTIYSKFYKSDLWREWLFKKSR